MTTVLKNSKSITFAPKNAFMKFNEMDKKKNKVRTRGSQIASLSYN